MISTWRKGIFSIIERNFKKNFKYCTLQYNFKNQEEIEINFLSKIMLIGINLPEKKNILTESAVEKLNEGVEKFKNDENLSVLILHGFGGNFCTGLENKEKVIETGNKLIKRLNALNKPIIGSLHGHIKEFGFQLALLCDMRAMDETALIGFGDRRNRLKVPEEVYKRLVSLVGITRAMEIVLTNCNWSADEAKSAGLVNISVECGCALGQSIIWAQSIAQVPSETIIQEKLKISSQMQNKL